MTRAVALTIRVRIGDDAGSAITVHGRGAWALMALMEAGERGCTPIDHPGPRWSSYVHDLRRLGFVIETVRERHGGEFPGDHARYVLRSPVFLLDHSEHGKESGPSKASVIVREPEGLPGGERPKKLISGPR
jgi:hypothetical protein